MADCSDCVFGKICMENDTNSLDDCWNSVDLDFYTEENLVSKDGEARWNEMSWNKVSSSGGNWDCVEKSEWEMFLEEDGG